MKILIIGANGQLGNALCERLEKKFKIVRSFRKDLNLTNFQNIKQYITNINPTIIINAAAYTEVDKAEQNKDLAFSINSTAVKEIAKVAKEKNIYLIHYSTDYVFDGLKDKPYIENDETNPLNIYGKSKLSGEKNLNLKDFDYLIFRTSWIISKYGKNFIKTILKLSMKRNYLEIVNDQIGAITSTNLICLATEKAIEDFVNFKKWESGIYHLSSRGKTTWFEIGERILKIASHKNISFEKVKVKPINTNNYKYLAKRPTNSILDCSKIEKRLNFNIPEWDSGLEDVVNSILKKYE